MEEIKKLSFLVPTLGERESELRRLFDSLVKQTVQAFEIILVLQGNFERIQSLLSEYDSLTIEVVRSEKGLSKARNVGMKSCNGEAIVLSDDDCWYPEDTVKNIIFEMNRNNADVLLTQIYDKVNDRLYKNYKAGEKLIDNRFLLSSKSSIEIAFRSSFATTFFDERFGLGSQCYVCCEEVDFLLNLYNASAKMMYLPFVTVFHERKYNGSTYLQVVAKGALYAKHYNAMIGFFICVKDLIFSHEFNFVNFYKGYFSFKQLDEKG